MCSVELNQSARESAGGKGKERIPLGILKPMRQERRYPFLHNSGPFSVEYTLRDARGRTLKRSLHSGTSAKANGLQSVKCIDHSVLVGKPLEFATLMYKTGATAAEQLGQLMEKTRLGGDSCKLREVLIDAGNAPRAVQAAMNDQRRLKPCVVTDRNQAANSLKELRVTLSARRTGGTPDVVQYDLSASLNKNPPRAGYRFDVIITPANPSSRVGYAGCTIGGCQSVRGDNLFYSGSTKSKNFSAGSFSLFTENAAELEIRAAILVYNEGFESHQQALQSYSNANQNSSKPRPRVTANFSAAGVRLQ
ncbi:MAG: hypothetical protein ACPG4N_12320 [Gammaproteobacteria bacterium]